MVRISDARMSGTAFGTIVLHASPEAAIGGPLALVRNGDTITLDVPRRQLTLNVAEEELVKRQKEIPHLPNPAETRGYRRLFHEQVTQAGQGCDFGFLTALECSRKTP